MKTYSAKHKDIKHNWYLIDASNQVLGRLASRIAHILRGKHKPDFTPHMNTGDCVIVINADKIKVTGKKMTDKIYYRHTGYVGGIKQTSFGKMQKTFPERPLEKAVKGMLPSGALGNQMFRNLKVYAGTEHKHQAQTPILLEN